MNLTRAFTLSLAASLLVGCQSHDDELASDYDRTAYVEGVPGGAVLETETLLATVSAIDSAKRTFTLRDDLGNQRTLVAPTQMHNFDQLKVGDRVKAVASQERIVYLRQPAEVANDGAAGVLVSGCCEGGCEFRLGQRLADERLRRAREPHLQVDVPPQRLATAWAPAGQPQSVLAELQAFRQRLQALAPPESPESSSLESVHV